MNLMEIARQIADRHEARQVAGDPQAKTKLVNEIAIALSDVHSNVGITEAVANRLRKKREAEPPAAPVPDPGMTISEKILNGKPLSGAEEDDIIFGGM